MWYFVVYPALVAWSIFNASVGVRRATTPSTETQIFNSPNLIKVDEIVFSWATSFVGVNEIYRRVLYSMGVKGSYHHLPRTGWHDLWNTNPSWEELVEILVASVSCVLMQVFASSCGQQKGLWGEQETSGDDDK